MTATYEVKLMYLEGRLDDVERELNIVDGRKTYLEERRKNLLKSIEALTKKSNDEAKANMEALTLK